MSFINGIGGYIMATIGKLVEVDVRELWKHEQYDFSNWLASEENIEYLNDILGLTLIDIDKEVYVGPYRCDVVAKDETSGITVIIENQLEPTNHEHLGKTITYASGLDAKVIVWIVKEAREEHRAAIEWLNNNTNSGINFFLIEIHAYKIGDSKPAPKFEVVEKPNDYVKRSKNISPDKNLKRSEAYSLEFWSRFNEILIAKNKPFSVKKALPYNWYEIAIGTSIAHLEIKLNNVTHNIITGLIINDETKSMFDRLNMHKEEIEKELELELEWNRMDNNKSSRINYYIKGLNFNNQENYEYLMNTAIDITVKMRNVLKKYI